MNEEKRAWTYCRINAPEDPEGRLEMQKKELMDYAEKMGFKVVGGSEDLGSGLDFNRKGLRKAIEAAAGYEIDVLLTKDGSRLGRDTVKTMECLYGLDQLGIKIYTPLEGEINFDAIEDIFPGLGAMKLE